MRLLLKLFLLASTSFGRSRADTCPLDRPISLCCRGDIAPYYSNSYAWGNLCGYYPTNTSELDGGRCSINTGPFSSCPSTFIAACCKGRWPGPDSQCAMGTDCAYPPTGSSLPAPIPTDWQLVSACSEDNPSRIYKDDVVTTLANNTPANCIEYCSSLTYRYAGVENGNECHCGTGFARTPIDTSPTDCNFPCAGDSTYTCGGTWRIQLYQGPVPHEEFPPLLQNAWWCSYDTPSRVFYDDHITLLSNNTPATCAWFCYDGGFTFAGVENGDECHCSGGFAGSGVPPPEAPSSDCSIPCAGNKALTCGGPWRLMFWSQH